MVFANSSPRCKHSSGGEQGVQSQFWGEWELREQGGVTEASPYHGERHPVDLVLIFGFVLPERAVPGERRKRALINVKSQHNQGISAVEMLGNSGASC